ncbi:MAG: glycosyltransferase family 4 protein, partial [bacterium]
VPELQTKTRRLGLQEKVNFTGLVPRQMVPQYIAAMNVAVQPDVTEYASPIKLFEYLAMGRAIIAPRKQNIQEILEDGKHALLYTPDDAQDLADKIERLYVDPQLRQRLGLAASRLIEERGFYWRSNAARIIDLLEGNHKQT